MRKLVYVVVKNARQQLLSVVETAPSDFKINLKTGEWDNGYSTGKSRIGERAAWWDQYRPGTVIAVYDRDNIAHLQSLANIGREIAEAQMQNRAPSREESH